MFAGLARAIAELDVPPTLECLEEVLSLRDRLDAKISTALRQFEEDEGWCEDGSLSLTAWLAAHGRRSRKEAHREAVAARRLASLPVTAAAWANGALSSAQVAAVVANVSSERVLLYAGHEREMTPCLAELTVVETAAAMRSWRLHAEATEDGAEPSERASELHLSKTLVGRSEVSGHLSAIDGAIVDAALNSVMGRPAPQSVPGEGPVPTTSHRRAEALVDLCRWFLDHFAPVPAGARQQPHVSVIVGLPELAHGGPGRLADGTPISAATVAQLACDAELHRVFMSGRSTILDYGSAVRTVGPALWAALVVRDEHCRHPGCDRPPAWCQARPVRIEGRAHPAAQPGAGL
jgi:Domain of unknown function (DUF222)